MDFLSIAATAVLLDSVVADGKPSAPDPLTIIKAAQDASSRALVSGTGEGHYKELSRKHGVSDWQATTTASIKVCFDRTRYYISLQYTKDPNRFDRRIIIYDAKAVFSAFFTEGSRPVGCQGYVFDAEGPPDGTVPPQAADFHFDVGKLRASILDVDAMVSWVGRENIRIRLTPQGDYVGEFRRPDLPKALSILEWPAKYGLNVARNRGFFNKREGTAWRFWRGMEKEKRRLVRRISVF
jgi:hypothetical protein